jgi:hypothetical protein
MKRLIWIFSLAAVAAVFSSCADQSTVTGVTSDGTLPSMTAPEHGPEYPSKTNYGHPGGM